jgi:hypothetical protein
MICPHCGLDALIQDIIPNYATHNVSNYNQAAVVATICCSKPVKVVPVRSVRVHAWSTSNLADDWGVKFK